jgi:hypothetical protein
VSADSIVPGAGNPQALNRYAYVFNNPLRYVDPSGHCPDCPTEKDSDGNEFVDKAWKKRKAFKDRTGIQIFGEVTDEEIDMVSELVSMLSARDAVSFINFRRIANRKSDGSLVLGNYSAKLINIFRGSIEACAPNCVKVMMDPSFSMDTAKQLRYTLAHELTHAIVDRQKGALLKDYEDKFYRRSNPQHNEPTEYGRESGSGEGLADTVALAVAAPIELTYTRMSSIDRLAFVRKHLPYVPVSPHQFSFRLDGPEYIHPY